MNDIPLNPRAAAAVLMDECDNDVERSKTLARRRLAQPEYEELRTVLWHAAIDLELDQLWRSGRDIRKREVSHPQVLPAPSSRQRMTPVRVLKHGEMSVPNLAMTAALNRRVAGLMHFEMPNGTHLADWTKRSLLEHGRKVISNGQSTTRTGFFFIAVAEALPKDLSQVKEVLTETDLERMYRQQALVPA